METAQFGAKAIDTTLRTLSTIPLIGPSIGYNPPLPLDQSLAAVAKSLEPIPKSFGTIEKSLRNTTDNLGNVEASIRDLGANIKGVDTNVADAQGVITQYQTVIAGLQTNLQGTETSIPKSLNTVAWVVTAFLVGFASPNWHCSIKVLSC
jgi:methyl-accepting chemotaxis protein